jgi:hypothetical protein
MEDARMKSSIGTTQRNGWRIPAAFLVVAATATALSCTGTGTSEERAANTGAARTEINPAGNNGTVKIQEESATDEIPDNDPHVGCLFKIEFRGFDEGDLQATWQLSAHAPSGSGEIDRGTVAIGEDGAGGAPDLDGVVHIDMSTYDLSSLEEHPQQGYHVRLDVNAEGSQGADTKHKTFWVRGCSSSGGSSGKTW